MSRKCTLCTSATLWETETDKEQKELGEAASEICQAFSRYVSLKQLIWRQMIPLKPLTIFPLFNALQLRKHWHAVDFNKAIKSTQEAKPLPLPDSFVSVFFFFPTNFTEYKLRYWEGRVWIRPTLPFSTGPLGIYHRRRFIQFRWNGLRQQSPAAASYGKKERPWRFEFL